jgi:hypothetical protein
MSGLLRWAGGKGRIADALQSSAAFLILDPSARAKQRDVCYTQRSVEARLKSRTEPVNKLLSV